MRDQRYQVKYLSSLKEEKRRHFIRSRMRKGQKIVKILGEETCLKRAVVLDLGCSIGIISDVLARRVNSVVGVDIDDDAIRTAARLHRMENCSFILADGGHLPFKSNCFDVVICNQVLEHVPNPTLLISEIYRTVKDHGLVYFAVGNRFVLFEPHYGLPFLSWLPGKVADLYLRITKRGMHYYERLPTYWSLKKILQPFTIKDKTVHVVKNPRRYFISDEIPSWLIPILKRLPTTFLRLLLPLFPSWIFILRKDHKN